MAKKELPKFVVGDTVEWTSQSLGFVKTKLGTVKAIVPAGERPLAYIESLGGNADPRKFGGQRKHDSYLVQLPGATRRVYWPLVAKLKKVEGK